ncbi:hypothetical protein MRB53_024173 [Persea americana]|uniref:Uncharacterized protein n=1 Tax=Persea americana TaxID=3435 RepID=A0ACC2LBY6_PERAE|nr:hypothetical protein MRB53_024173 [Persea americana]
MSKKKSFSGSTMTLKDFHGGSIPSDLPLPSAPGVVVRPSDRSPFDRQIPTSAWGNQIGRQDHRSRPGSSGATRSFDEKAAFLSHPPHIGRNFDEDERKPFDGGVAGVPRRSVREDDRPPSMGRSDNPKPESGRAASPAWPASAAALQSPVSVVKGVAAANLQIPGGNGGAGSTPNAWGVRKEVVEPVLPSSALSGQSTVSKFAQASALEKISSGRWQSKPALASVSHHVADVEVISYSESEAGDTHFGVDQLNRIEYDGIRGKFGEGGGRDFSDSEGGRFNRIEHDGVRGRFGEGGGRDFSDSERERLNQIEHDGARGRFGEGGGRDYSDSERGRLNRIEHDGIRGRFGEGGGRDFSETEKGRFHRIEHDGIRGRFGEGGGRDVSDTERGRFNRIENDGIRGRFGEGGGRDFLDTERGRLNQTEQHDGIRGRFGEGGGRDFSDAERGRFNRIEHDGIRGRIGEGGVRDFSNSERGRFNRIEHDGIRGRFGEGGGRDFSDSEKGRSSGFYSDGIRPASTDGKLGGCQLQSQLQAPPESLERPKLKLLPRTKPLESSETHVGDYKQAYQPPADPARVEAVIELHHGNVNPPKPGSAGSDGGSRAAIERPRLSLKPRSQPLEQSDGSGERERKSLFGGARPRELVLKERGVDKVMINSLDLNQPSNRVKQDVTKAETKLEADVPNNRYSERPENFLLEQRLARDFERKDHHPDAEKTDMQRGSRKNENRRNSRDFEKPHERRQEPESWRKPIEPPRQAPAEAAPGSRYGKTASALELAQAFSRSHSKTDQWLLRVGHSSEKLWGHVLDSNKQKWLISLKIVNVTCVPQAAVVGDATAKRALLVLWTFDSLHRCRY